MAIETGSELSIRPLARSDIHAVVDLHTVALPKDFITSLGRRFLSEVFYASILDRPQGLGHVAMSPAGLMGFVVGAHPAKEWYHELPRRHPRAFVRGAMASLADGPDGLIWLAEVGIALLRGGEHHYPADLGYIAVSAQARGKGLGGRLVRAHLEAVAAHGARGCWTKTYQTNTAARRMYEASGFSAIDRRRIRGVWSIYYGVALPLGGPHP